MAYTVQHTAIENGPYWYHLDSNTDYLAACRRAQSYALDHGGYVCVKDQKGETVFGTDPDQLNRAIIAGTNRDFPKEAARRHGCCV